jgi:hypothetical protein
MSYVDWIFALHLLTAATLVGWVRDDLDRRRRAAHG